MADMSIYELEDLIWDDFERNVDHIVPHSTEDKCEGDSCKKPRVEVTPVQSKEGNLDASSSVFQLKEERESQTLNKETDMIEKDSWSHIPDGVFAAPGDSNSARETLSVQSGDAKLLKYSNINCGSELCTAEGMLKDTSGAVDRISCNDLNLFSNDGGDKESSDLLYFGWPDIGNLEDVDGILSNCDSSFELGITGNNNDLVWLTSEDPGGGYVEALKMFPCSEPSALTNVSQDHEPRESEDNKASHFVSESKVELNLKDQKEQSRQQNQTEGTKAGHFLKTYGLKSNDIQIPSSDKSDKPFNPIGKWQQAKYLGHDSVGYMQSGAYLHPGHDHISMQARGGSSMPGIIKASSQVRSMESSSPPSFTGNLIHSLVPSQKQFQMLENKIGCQSDMEGVKKGASAELDSFDVPEGSSISSELDEISPEATTFRQLQQVMLQLDIRTKLCIRDSLYRLARSAEQRHNYACIRDNPANCGGTSGPIIMTMGTNKYTALMDLETNTNPIDRIMAHLLFHRPSDSCNMPTTLPLKLNTKVHGSMTGLPKKPSCQQAETASDDKISSTRTN